MPSSNSEEEKSEEEEPKIDDMVVDPHHNVDAGRDRSRRAKAQGPP